jgi:hypothetical protein
MIFLSFIFRSYTVKLSYLIRVLIGPDTGSFAGHGFLRPILTLQRFFFVGAGGILGYGFF